MLTGLLPRSILFALICAMTVLSGFSQTHPSDSTLSPVTSYMIHGDTAYCFTKRQVSNIAYHVERSKYLDTIKQDYKRLTSSYEEQIDVLERQKGNCEARLKVKDSIIKHKDIMISRQDTLINRKEASLEKEKHTRKILTWVSGTGWVAFAISLLL